MRSIALAVVLACVALSGCKPSATTSATVAKKPTRDEFRKLVMGKTKDEVLAAVGKPEFTGSHSDSREFWHYANLVVDPINGNLDWRTTVNFENGIVVKTDP